ncbi:MAG: family 43 glycosylhydrolase [Bacteroidaceae bacterium]|nr:family 43 glycosylhydrolase [Bacteroidaceae bacterium]
MKHRLTALVALLTLSFHLHAQSQAAAYKGISEGNPISPCVFCADPTAIDYQGRLYVYGTNDNQQYLINKKTGSNGYGNIKSLVVFSTDDMVNWTFHGTIDVGKVCGSWCGQSWAPSAVWRTTTTTGRDEFFIYFANGGGSVGVIKAATPIGPFKSPLTGPLIQHGTPGVDPCNWVFDPGVVIDDNGVGWIAFGGGDPQSTGSNLWPGNSRIAKLKTSMTALDGPAVNMPAPYLFEASELNMMDGRYVYTYNTSWSDRNDWSQYEKRGTNAAPSSCSMCYMVTDTPLDPDSWEYRGEYVPNEGNFGMGWGNNHTHLHKFQGSYYLFYHSTLLEQTMKSAGAMDSNASGYRSIGVNKAVVNETTQKINKMTLNKTGVTAIQNLNPYVLQEAETMATSGGVTYEDFTNIIKNTSINSLGNDASRNLQVAMAEGAWTQLRKVDFGSQGAVSFMLRAKGSGTLEIRLNNRNSKASATLEFSSTGFADHTVELDPTVFQSVKTVYFVFTSATNVQFDAWRFTESADAVSSLTSTPSETASFDLSGRPALNGRPQQRLVIKQYTDANGRKRNRKVVKSN